MNVVCTTQSNIVRRLMCFDLLLFLMLVFVMVLTGVSASAADNTSANTLEKIAITLSGDEIFVAREFKGNFWPRYNSEVQGDILFILIKY